MAAINNNFPLRTFQNLQITDISYPGKPGVFISKHAPEKWNEEPSASFNICRQLSYENQEKDSIIKAFSLNGHIYGNLSLWISCTWKDKQKMENLFNNLKIVVNDDSIKDYGPEYIIENINNLRIMFKLIKKNNYIPQNHLEKMEHIIAKGSTERFIQIVSGETLKNLSMPPCLQPSAISSYTYPHDLLKIPFPPYPST